MGNAQVTEGCTVHSSSLDQLFVTYLIGFKCMYWSGGVVTCMLVGMCITEKMSSHLHEKLLIWFLGGGIGWIGKTVCDSRKFLAMFKKANQFFLIWPLAILL